MRRRAFIAALGGVAGGGRGAANYVGFYATVEGFMMRGAKP
jgi:hypothetical protein